MSAQDRSQADALLPCPFCGGEAEFERRGTPRQSCIVVCRNCGGRRESSDEYERSGSSWNERVALASAAPPAPAAQAVQGEYPPLPAEISDEQALALVGFTGMEQGLEESTRASLIKSGRKRYARMLAVQPTSLPRERPAQAAVGAGEEPFGWAVEWPDDEGAVTFIPNRDASAAPLAALRAQQGAKVTVLRAAESREARDAARYRALRGALDSDEAAKLDQETDRSMSLDAALASQGNDHA